MCLQYVFGMLCIPQFSENSFKKAENVEPNAVLLSLLFTLDNVL